MPLSTTFQLYRGEIQLSMDCNLKPHRWRNG